MKTIFAADMHLKPGIQPEQNRALRRFLDEIADADRLVLLGDAFNGWYERAGRTAGDFSEILGLFRSAAARGLEIHHVSGNRDFVVAPGLTQPDGWRYPGYFRGRKSLNGVSVLAENGVNVWGPALRLRQDGLLIHCAHGDQLCLRDWGHQMLRWWLMSLAPRIGGAYAPFYIVEKFVGFAQNRDVFPHFGLIPYAKNPSDEALAPLVEAGVDLIFCGHFHRVEEREVCGRTRSGRLVIFQCWSHTGIYGILENGALKSAAVSR